jgi:hypothetical protein
VTEPNLFTIEGVRFVSASPLRSGAAFWRAHPEGIAFGIVRMVRRDGEPYYQVDGVSYRSLDNAGRAAIRRKKAAVDYARTIVEAYDKAVAKQNEKRTA